MKLCAFITGASRGIGKAIALRFAKEGYNLVITCKSSEDELFILKQYLEKNYSISCLALTGDMGSVSFVTKVFEQIDTIFGRLDVLVNNAGISYIGLLQDMDIDQWNGIINTNLTSLFLTSKFSIPLMLRHHYGSIINISSVWGKCGASCEVAYSASKGGVNAFTKSLAKELAPSNIRVNALACGIIDTSMNGFLSQEEKEILLEDVPLARMGTVEEVSDSVYHIALKETYMTGQIITIDGGFCI